MTVKPHACLTIAQGNNTRTSADELFKDTDPDDVWHYIPDVGLPINWCIHPHSTKLADGLIAGFTGHSDQYSLCE